MMDGEIVIYHFNDVYNLSDPGLVSRFGTILREGKAGKDPLALWQDDPSADVVRSKQPSPIVVFSGDAFSPSLESSILRGDHMVPVLNELGVDVACYGNHDFDFGEARLNELSSRTNFPWVLSNVVHEDTQNSGHRLLSQAREYFILQHGIHKIGFFGLAGTDWPSNCQNLPPCKILSPVDEAQRLARYLRTVKQCDFVIAITHMRLTEDLDVSNATNGGENHVDLLLGGHDHDVLRRGAASSNSEPSRICVKYDNDTVVRDGQVSPSEDLIRVVKSGTNWRGLSVIKLRPSASGTGYPLIASMRTFQFTDLAKLPFFPNIQPDQRLERVLAGIHEQIEQTAQHPLFHSLTSLDGRSGIIRSSETNLGNMIADAVRAYYGVQIALVNSGGIRCDKVIERTLDCSRVPRIHALTVKDIISVVPFDNAFVVKEVRGRILLTALENSISDAHTDGRFLQVSGLRIKADWGRQEGQRLVNAWYVPPACPAELRSSHGGLDSSARERERSRDDPSESPLDPDAWYTVAMVAFLAQGFDGYVQFPSQKTIVGEEGAMTDTRLMLNALGHDMGSSDGHKLRQGGESPAADDEDTVGIHRARDAIVVGYAEDGLPIVEPNSEDRVVFI